MNDHGDEVAFDRFVLELGEVDMSESGKYTFKMSKLPPVKLNLSMHMTDFPAEASGHSGPRAHAEAELAVDSSHYADRPSHRAPARGGASQPSGLSR